MRVYELLLILRPELKAEELDKEVEGLTTYLREKAGAELLRTELWGRRRLAYEIKKLRDGNYVLVHFRLQRLAALQEINYNLRLNQQVLRFMMLELSPQRVKTLMEELEKQTVKAETPNASGTESQG